jgi:hypothetical protein
MGLKEPAPSPPMRRLFRSTLSNGRWGKIGKLEFDAEVWYESSKMPLVETERYITDDGHTLAEVAEWKGDSTGLINEMMVVLHKKKPTP